MTHNTLSAEHHAVARRMAERGYRIVIGYGKGGFWVRNPDMTRPPFVDHNSFISFRNAKMLFLSDRPSGVVPAIPVNSSARQA
jgi:hypothetical protein